MTKIALTGGGTAGHVMPHIALLPYYRQLGWEIFYIGSSGIERELVAKTELTFYTIKTGKLRRYFSWQNIFDLGRILIGIFQSIFLLWRLKPNLVFCKGGFVSVPVALAAWVLRIPVVSHESDLTPGLANRLIKPLCKTIFYSFPETSRYLKGTHMIETGIPVRKELLLGRKEEGIKLCGFKDARKPILLVMGGSLGAERINLCLAEILPELVKEWLVIHLTGKGKAIGFSDPSYKAFEFIHEGIEHIFAMADSVVCRAGANSLFELKSLAKPMLLIPLERASRGDQIDNAHSFVEQGWAMLLREPSMNAQNLRLAIAKLHNESPKLKEKMICSANIEATATLIVENLKQILTQSM